MFDKFKEIAKLKQMEGELAKERATVKRDGINVTVTGKMEVEEIKLNSEKPAKDQEEAVKDCINEAMKKMQMEAAKKMFNM